MKRFLKVASALLLLLAVSCAGQGFTASSVSLRERGGFLIFSFIPDRSADYTLILRSPDGELEWSSPLTSDEPYMVSDELGISSGAAFPEGDYTWFIMDDDGNELTGSISL